MKTLLKFLFNTQYKLSRSKPAQPDSGFTMIELLIGTILAFLIIGPLLGFVVSILNDDTREQTKSAAEFELQAAIDFMAEDLSQAYYIYSPDQLDNVGPLPEPEGGEALVVFWKLKRLNDAVPPAASEDNPIDCDPETCDDANVRALVAYYLVQDDEEIWCQPKSDANNCPQRIVRYEFNDGLKRPGGLYYEDGETKKSQQKDDGYNENFNQGLLFTGGDRQTATENVTTGNFNRNNNPGQVLINYVDIDNNDDDNRFRIPLDPENPDEEPLQRIRFQIMLNSLRRTDANAGKCREEDNAPAEGFCQRATIEVQGLELSN